MNDTLLGFIIGIRARCCPSWAAGSFLWGGHCLADDWASQAVVVGAGCN